MQPALLLLFTLPLLSPFPAHQEAPPNLIGLQVRVADDLGTPLVGEHTLELIVYDAAVGGSALWSEVQSVKALDGLVHLEAGSVQPLPTELFEASERWLTLAVDGDAEMLPRLRLSSLPYARKAAVAQALAANAALPPGSVTEAALAPGAIQAGHIANGAVGVDALGAGSVGPQALQAGAVAGVHLTPGAVGAAQLGPGAVAGASILDGSIGADDLARPLTHFLGGEPVIDARHVGIGPGLRGRANNGIGLWGEAANAAGIGAYGANFAEEGEARGVYGLSTASRGLGVFGEADAPTGETHGVFGTSASSSGIGTAGVSTAPTGQGIGVYGSTQSVLGQGVLGESLSDSGPGAGVEGRTVSSSGVGVRGLSSGTLSRGVHGASGGSSGVGVFGIATATEGDGVGVEGQASSPDGVAVRALHGGEAGDSTGLYAESASPEGAAIRAVNSAAAGDAWAIRATSNAAGAQVLSVEATDTSEAWGWAIMARGHSQDGGAIFARSEGATGIGVYGSLWNFDSEQTGYGVYGGVSWTGDYAVYASGDFAVSAGEKSFIQPHPTDPTRELHFACLEGNESGTYFRGTGRSIGGRAVIEVPEEFRLATEAEGLTVQLTPVGALALLAVESQSLDAIVVLASQDVDFHYTVNGVRRGFDDFQVLRPNRAFVPTYSDVPFGTQYRDGIQELLIESRILGPDLLPDPATAASLGWELRPAPADMRAAFAEVQR